MDAMRRWYRESWTVAPGAMVVGHFALVGFAVVVGLMVIAPLAGLIGLLAWLVALILLVQLASIFDLTRLP